VWADWLKAYTTKDKNKHFAASGVTELSGHTTGTVKMWGGDARSRRLKVVCGATQRRARGCNNGWMGELQEKARESVIKLVKGETFTFTTESQRTLATWAAMTVMVAEWLSAPMHRSRRWLWHSAIASDTIRGHVFCSFLALLLRKELIDRLAAAGRRFEWADIVRDLDRLVQTDVDQGGRRLRIRAAAPGCSGAVFQAVGVALPPMIQITAQPPPASRAQSSDPWTGENRPDRASVVPTTF